jgi:ubiquitin-conjugating enzyme E2 O
MNTIAGTIIIIPFSPLLLERVSQRPGDHVIWKAEDEARAAIVQSVNAVERTAVIIYSDTGETETVSVLELDPHGSTDLSVNVSPHEGFGVRRGELVFVHREGTTNGLQKPRVPRIGEVEPWVQETQVDADGQFAGWRKEMSTIGAQIATARAVHSPDGGVKRLQKGDNFLHWIGEVTGVRYASSKNRSDRKSHKSFCQLCLDGTVEVTHPDASVAVYPLERLTRLNDGIEQIEGEMWGDEMSDGHGSYADGEEVWTMDQDGVWQPQSHEEEDEWEETEDDDESMDIDAPGWAEDEQTISPVDIRPPSPIPVADRPTDLKPGLEHQGDNPNGSPVVVRHPSPDVPKDVSDDIGMADGDSERSEMPWKRFDILPSAPVDHTFYNTTPAQPSKSFLARLTREYRVLSTSLPGLYSFHHQPFS